MTAPSLSRVTIAPMMDWTDRHCRYFHRLLSPHAGLYTEMVTTGALIHGDRDRHLAFDPAEHPLGLQLGGNDPAALAVCAKIAAEEYGYDEINLNCGCPSDRVQSGVFGACLMKDPGLVARCVEAMKRVVAVPVTVKSRIGVDDSNDYPFLGNFVRNITDAGCGTLIVHARKAWLQGLSPKENREVPPLRYDIAAEVKRHFPSLRLIVNGGITTLVQIREHLETFDGVMIGREAYHNPWFLTEIERGIFGNTATPDRRAVVEAFMDYAEARVKEGVPLKAMTRHILGLFQHQRGARHWKRTISENAHIDGMDPHILLRQAMG